jgi:membrane protease YdiL (CAAX protease family)
MTTEHRAAPTFWSTVRLLLGVTRKRAAGRRKRQQELLQQRARQSSTDWSALGFAAAVVFMAVLNGGAAFVVRIAVDSGERIQAERQGKIVVSRDFLDAAKRAEATARESSGSNQEDCTVINGWANCPLTPSTPADLDYSSEAKEIVDHYGGTKSRVEQRLRDSYREHGAQEFIDSDQASPGVTALSTAGRLPELLGSVVLLWWAVMLVFQGEGLELDLQRRRHPMWEWLFSHPVPSGAIFLAEMLSPIAANPIYWSGPLFAGFLFGLVYDPWVGLLAAFLIGVPITVAAACLGKALEIGVILRFPPRSRGAIIGFMGWMGYASMMLFVVAGFALPKVANAIAGFLDLFTVVPWPWLRLFLGGRSDGSFSFPAGVLACLIVSGITVAAAVRFSVWGTEQGLSGNFAATDSGPPRSRKESGHFGKEPLYRKEFLWFMRDRSAIVQTILIPLTVACVQAFNLRGLLSNAQGAWNYLCGTAILFGTYFLWILGPKSLASEGTALWIALTWPRGLESLLKAKAWLWSMISSGIVVLILGYAAFLFPENIWQIVLVGIGWFVFGRSMAEKSVTLVTVMSSSGEPEKIHWGRRWATQLGMLTFAIGVLTQQWPIAVQGIVYSYITAAAMWQNFRARLPYLYDPWSEELPPAPTLMHAMIAISILVEAGAVVTGILVAIAGREDIAVAQAMSYAICSVIVSIGVSSFLGGRGVLGRDIWKWGAPVEDTIPWWRAGRAQSTKLFLMLMSGATGGVLLGLIALGYLKVLHLIPATHEMLLKAHEEMAKVPNFRLAYAVMAVAFAPFAEEYLFRGLLYRALDREWGGWRAVMGSAAFFAIYHHPLSWFPVALLGMTSALLFKKTGWLMPSVLLHMVYNAVVLAQN